VQVRDYELSELHFAYACHAYLRWSTHRRKAYAPPLALYRPTFHALVEPLGVHVLECDSRPTETRVLVSLRPTESLSAAAGKLKGQASKWLRQRLGLDEPTTLLARGYFACTAGGATTDKVEAYLESQSEHHHYDRRPLSPVWVQSWQPEREPQPWWQEEHADAHLQYHVVLATAGRRGVLGEAEGKAVAGGWEGLQRAHRFALRKVSFLPDHVHVALWLHPGVAPANMAVTLMNDAQRRLAAEFPGELLRAGVSRVWQPSGYVGSYGDLATRQVEQYVRRWQERE
jgi:putative transposase